MNGRSILLAQVSLSVIGMLLLFMEGTYTAVSSNQDATLNVNFYYKFYYFTILKLYYHNFLINLYEECFLSVLLVAVFALCVYLKVCQFNTL